MQEPAPFDEQPGPFWHPSEEEWRDLNRWMEERYAVTQAASDGYRLDPETGEMILIEDAEAEEIRDEATVQAEGAAMPNESLPPLPTQEAWQPARQDWAGVRRVARGAGEAVYGRVPALAGDVRIRRTRRTDGNDRRSE